MAFDRHQKPRQHPLCEVENDAPAESCECLRWGRGRGRSAIWVDSMPEAYESGSVTTVFAPFAKDRATRAVQLAPKRVLELAAGTGVLTAEVLAMLPSAHVVATALNEAMVALGERRAPGAVLANCRRDGPALRRHRVRSSGVEHRRPSNFAQCLLPPAAAAALRAGCPRTHAHRSVRVSQSPDGRP